MQCDVRNIITAAAAVNAITFSTKVTLGGRTTFACRVLAASSSLSPLTSYFSAQRCLGVIKATKLPGSSAAALSMLLEPCFYSTSLMIPTSFL